MKDLILTNGIVVYELDEAIALIQKVQPGVSKTMYETSEADLKSDFDKAYDQINGNSSTFFEILERTKFEQKK